MHSPDQAINVNTKMLCMIPAVAKSIRSNYDAPGFLRPHIDSAALTALHNRLLVRTPTCLFLFFLALASPCMAQEEMRPFTTDGCSRFPDRSKIDKSDWCECCVRHDLAYWRGGSAEARLQADKELSACVLRTTGNKGLAELMFAGVRAGGGPYLNTTYRWGYGWPFGKGYVDLTPEEVAQADKLEQEYLKDHPALMCPSQPSPPLAESGVTAASRLESKLPVNKVD